MPPVGAPDSLCPMQQERGAQDERLRVLVTGNGPAALELMLALDRLARGRASVDLVTPARHYSYRSLAGEGGTFALERRRRLDLDRFAAAHGARHRPGRIARMDPVAHTAWTSDGGVLHYDVAVLADEGAAVEAVPGALTYRGAEDAPRVRDLLAAVRERRADRLAFVVPPGVTWSLPLYELALAARRWLTAHAAFAEIMVVTAEPAAAHVLGPGASGALEALLRRRKVALRTGCGADRLEDGRLWPAGGDVSVRTDRAVALPRRAGRVPAGVPADQNGFPLAGDDGAVDGSPDVFALGTGPAAQSANRGLVTQQADALAARLARLTGVDLPTSSTELVLRGVLLTGEQPAYLARSSPDERIDLLEETLWWPPPEIDGRHLSAVLAGDLELAAPLGGGHETVARRVPSARPPATEGRSNLLAAAQVPR